MATHDYVIANGTGAAVRSDLNNALAAIVSNNSSSSEPGTTYAYQWWADTNANVLKIRNSANDGWITLRELDGTMLIEDGSASTPGLAFADDVNTGIFSPAADQIGFATGGAERLEIGSSEVVFNDPSNDVDFRVESNGNTHMLFVDAGNDRVGIGASAPENNLHVKASSGYAELRLEGASSAGGTLLFYEGSTKRADIFADPSSNIVFRNTNESARIDSSGRLLIGGTNTYHANADDLVVQGTGKVGVTIASTDSDASSIYFADSTSNPGTYACYFEYDHSVDAIKIGQGNSERLRLDSSGRLLVGTTNVIGGGTYSKLHLVDASGPEILFGRNDSSVTDGNSLGGIRFYGNDGGSYQEGAHIIARADGTHANNDKPTRLVFSTTAGGASSATEAMRISNTQHVSIGTTTANRTFQVGKSGAETFELEPGESSNNNLSLHFNRNTSTYITNEVRAIDHRFLSSTSEKVRVSSNGLSFNGDTASANMLDDYEEGTFTPSIANRTISTAEAYYVKIGELVRFNIIVQGLNSSLTGTDILIGGLPYASKNANGIGLINFGDVSGVTYEVNFGNIYGRINGNVSYIQLLQQKIDGSVHDAFSGYSGKGLGTGVILRGFGWYMTA